jgi:hypothetical protein
MKATNFSETVTSFLVDIIGKITGSLLWGKIALALDPQTTLHSNNRTFDTSRVMPVDV